MLEDLARARGMGPSYVSRVLRLTLLAPEIVEAILDGRQPAVLRLDDLLKGFPLEWEWQCSGLMKRHPSISKQFDLMPLEANVEFEEYPLIRRR